MDEGSGISMREGFMKNLRLQVPLGSRYHMRYLMDSPPSPSISLASTVRQREPLGSVLSSLRVRAASRVGAGWFVGLGVVW